MVKTNVHNVSKIPEATSIYMSYLNNYGKMKISDIVKLYPQYAERSIYRHCKIKINPNSQGKVDKRTLNKGRPCKLLDRHKRSILRQIPKLRNSIGSSFTTKRIKLESGVSHVCDRTIRRWLNKNDYEYKPKRRKGIVTATDCKKTKEVCNQMSNNKRRFLDQLCQFLFRWRWFHT